MQFLASAARADNFSYITNKETGLTHWSFCTNFVKKTTTLSSAEKSNFSQTITKY